VAVAAGDVGSELPPFGSFELGFGAFGASSLRLGEGTLCFKLSGVAIAQGIPFTGGIGADMGRVQASSLIMGSPPAPSRGPNEGMNVASELPGRRPAVGRDNCTRFLSPGDALSRGTDYRLAVTRLKDACGADEADRATPGP
jgi:hypothetical protein